MASYKWSLPPVRKRLSFVIKKQQTGQRTELTIHSGMWKAEVPSLPSHFSSIVQAWVRYVLKPVWKGQGYLRAQRILRPSDSEGWRLKEAVISFHRSFLFKSRSGASCLANLSPANLKAFCPPLKIRADAKL